MVATPVYEEKFWLVFDHAAVGMAIVLPDGRFLRANPQLCKLLGYAEDDLKELDFQALTRREDLDQELKLITKLRKGQIPSYQLDKRYIRRDGTTVWVHVSVTLARDRVHNPIHYVHVVQDITALREWGNARAQLKALTLSLEEAVIEHTRDGIITGWSAGAERIYGYSAAQMEGRNITALAAPDRQEDAARLVERVKKGEQVSHHETVHVAKDGSHLRISLTATPIRSGGNKVVGATVIAADVTARRCVEETLCESEHRLAQMLEALPIGVLVIDAAGQPSYSNRIAQQILGRGVSPQRAPDGEPGDADLHQICLVGTDEEYPPDRLPAVRALHGVTSTVEDMEVHQPERIVPVQVTGAPIFDGEGHVICALATFRDIGERHATEQALASVSDRYQAICEKASDLVSMHDVKGTYIFTNPASEALLGYSPEELIGQEMASIVHPQDLPTVAKIYSRYLAGADDPVRATYRLRRKDGEYLWVETYARPLAGTYGLKREIIAVTRSVDGGAHRRASLTPERKHAVITTRELEDAPLRDELTGLRNREAAEEFLTVRLASRRAASYPLGCIILDVDELEAINDKYDRAVGDLILKKIGRILVSSCRTGDFVARYGGDEFLVALPNTDAAGTVVVGEKLISNIRTAFWADTPVTESITASAGGTCIRRYSGISLSELMSTLEAQLAEAKEGGRNRMVMNARRIVAAGRW